MDVTVVIHVEKTITTITTHDTAGSTENNIHKRTIN
jgi:hypothetical protein